MPLIKDNRQIEDRFVALENAEGLSTLPVGAGALVPLAVWQEERDALLASGRELGVALAAGEDPRVLFADLDKLSLVSVDFPAFKDGRGYSAARRLRRAGFTGELRATGNVLFDQIAFMVRVGIDAFETDDRVGPAEVEEALNEISVVFQPSADRLVPAFAARMKQQRIAAAE